MNELVHLKRDPGKLQAEKFDVFIAGGGIFGACAAWEATLRGYKVALVEQNDFGSGVSANSFKMVHGGIRYMQHLDIPRVRHSCEDRSSLLRIAPHLVSPLPIVIPTYGYGASGKPFLSTGMYMYDLLTADRNRGIQDEDRKVPWTRLLGRDAVLDYFPGLESRNLTGGAQFADAQMYNPARLVLAFIQSAASKGAQVCNYARVDGYETSGKGVEQVRVIDELTGDTFHIRAKVFLNAAGPWTDELLNRKFELKREKPGVYSRDACFVVPRKFDHDLALAVLGQTRDPDAFMSRPARHLFVVPWRDYSLIGVWHKVVAPTPDKIGIERAEIETFINEIHGTYPDLALSSDEVSMCNWGLVPFGEEQKGGKDLSYGKRSILVDHQEAGGPPNLVSLIGVRYTVGRTDARWALQLVADKLKDDRQAPKSDNVAIYGGAFDSFALLSEQLKEQLPDSIDDSAVTALAHNHGSNAHRLLASSRPEAIRQVANSHVLEAEIENAVRNEMAMTLGDVVFRRTDLASGGSPGDECLEKCAEVTQNLLGLSNAEIEQQLAELKSRIPGWS
jgi:glycerol-3-phosphate dehydrogenase